MLTNPSDVYTVFDLEATSAHPQEAEIVQLAALRADGSAFTAFVATSAELSRDADVWSITKLNFDAYQQNKQPGAKSAKCCF